MTPTSSSIALYGSYLNVVTAGFYTKYLLDALDTYKDCPAAADVADWNFDFCNDATEAFITATGSEEADITDADKGSKKAKVFVAIFSSLATAAMGFLVISPVVAN